MRGPKLSKSPGDLEGTDNIKFETKREVVPVRGESILGGYQVKPNQPATHLGDPDSSILGRIAKSVSKTIHPTGSYTHSGFLTFTPSRNTRET